MVIQTIGRLSVTGGCCKALAAACA